MTGAWINGSGIEVPVLASRRERPLEPPGAYPYVRGIRADGYRSKPWTMRQYAGFGSAAETNERFRLLRAQGQTGISVAFDLPTQLGLDSDDPRALGEVGRTGVAIDSLLDMRELFAGIPLDAVSTSMTINAPAAVLLVLYELVAQEQGIAPAALSGTIQNDVLKEYVARGNYIYPPAASMRLTVDTLRYATERLPRFNPISISGYHIREAGSSAVEELAFTLANGIAYVEAARAGGLEPSILGERLSFFFNAHSDFFEEVAKFRAARRMWARIMRDRFGVTGSRAQMLRFHAQTGGSTLTAQQPDVNVARVTVQALAAVCGGAQSLHTNGFDEALALPTERSATLALRTQQVLAFESGTRAAADPLGGSEYVEFLTDELERRAEELIAEVDRRGGAVAAIEQGFVADVIDRSAYEAHRRLERGEDVVVGVNRFREEADAEVPLHRLDPAIEADQVERTATLRSRRDAGRVESALAALAAAADSPDAPIVVPMRDALEALATVGEVSGVLRSAWGTHDR